LGRYDPKIYFRVVYPGLNFHCYCHNEKCDSHKNGSGWVWVRIGEGYGDFDIGQEKTKAYCSACKQKLLFKNVNNLGYTKASIFIDGLQLDDA